MLLTSIPTISRLELMDRLRRGDLIQLVNVLKPRHRGLGMIHGSVHIPLSALNERMHELDPGREVVVYCAGRECDASRKAADLLAHHGFDVRAYEGGLEEWKAAGLPLEY